MILDRGALQGIDKVTPDQTSRKRPVILVFSDYYLPGYKSGGGMRTLVNVVDRFGEEYDFRIVTRDHDGATELTPYPGIEYDFWMRVGKASVLYLRQKQIKISMLKVLIADVGPDIIFCNSYFSTLTIFTLTLRRLGIFKNIPIVIAPQGELSPGALGLKTKKKQAFLQFAFRVGLYREVIWRTSSELEADEVRKCEGDGGRIFVAPDMSPRRAFPGYTEARRPEKKKGSVRLVFVSRIHPKKNLLFMLELLGEIDGAVEMKIVGPSDDDAYLLQCHRKAAELPQNVNVKFVGEVDHESVFDVMTDSHFFVLPSLSENFGHVFIEALSAGLPLVISNRTPWDDLTGRNIGWDLPLEDRQAWIDTLGRCIGMSAEDLRDMSRSARKFAEDWINNPAIESSNRDVFEHALSMRKHV